MTETTTNATAIEQFCNGQSVGIGSLPHRDAAAAAAFSISEFDIATVPSLPARSAAEGMIAQALGGRTDVGDIDGFSEIDPGIDTDEFGGLRAFLDLAQQVGVDGSPVKWQFVGPVTLGVALNRAGVPRDEAFRLAAESVRHHTVAIGDAIAQVLPNSPQLMLLDEPQLVELMEPGFPIPPDVAVDLISTGMAAASTSASVGLHCCGPSDIATMLEAGPQVVSVPASEDLVEYAGYLGRFLASGGVIVWGVLPTAGPLPVRADRFWRSLSEVWCKLVERGLDASDLRQRSMVSPACGLVEHPVSSARRIARLTAEVGHKVNAQAMSTKLAFGA